MIVVYRSVLLMYGFDVSWRLKFLVIRPASLPVFFSYTAKKSGKGGIPLFPLFVLLIYLVFPAFNSLTVCLMMSLIWLSDMPG